MKKIVGIIAAATMAASMFAVDFSAGVRLQADLFNYDAGSKTIKLLEEHHENQFYHAPISFAASGDVAGGQLKLSNVKGDEVVTNIKDDGTVEKATIQTVVADAWSIWFKPVDVLKVTVGRWSTNLNQEHIGWCNSDSGIETDGFALSVATGAFSADVFLASGNGNYFFTKAGEADAAISEVYAKAQFSADFGTVNGFVNTINNAKDYRFGAGVNVAGLPVGLWLNVIGTYAAKDFQRIRVEADVSGAIDSVGYELFLVGGYNMKPNAGAANAFTGVEGWHLGGSYYYADPYAFCGFYAKLSMPVAGLGAYVELKDSNVLAKDFNMTIKPGFTTNVGACAINAAVEITAKKDITVSVPVEFKVNF